MAITTAGAFVKKLQELGYSKNTILSIGFYDQNGEWYGFEIEEIEDGDREVGVDDIGVILKPNKEYEKSILENSNIELEEDLRAVISKYC